MPAVRWDSADPELVDVDRPTAAPGEVLVRPTVVGICGTDLHAASLPGLFRPGTVLGHEMVGVIAAGGGGWAPGTHVVVNPNGAVCGTCPQCRTGRTNLCFAATREHCVGVQRDGGLADLVAVPSRSLHAVRSIPDEVAVWTEPMAAAVRAVARCLDDGPQQVAVFGGGSVGLLAGQLLARAGLLRLTIFEPRADRRETARALGLDAAAPPTEPGSDAPGYDAALDCAGVPASLQVAMSIVRPAGRIVVLGVPAEPVPIDVGRLVLNEITIEGSMIYTDSQFSTALGLLEAGSVDTAPLVSAVISLAEFTGQYARLRRGDGVGQKVLVRVGA